MISQLNDHMIDIQYKSDKLIEKKTLEFNQHINTLLMQIEDYYMQNLNKQYRIDHLNKVINLKEDDEALKNQELFMSKLTIKIVEGKNDSITEELEELQMKYDEILTLYEVLEPSLVQLQNENKGYKFLIEKNEKEIKALKLIETKYFELKHKVTKECAIQTTEVFNHQTRKVPATKESIKNTHAHNEERTDEDNLDETHPLIKSKHINRSKGLIKKGLTSKDTSDQDFKTILNINDSKKQERIEQESFYHTDKESNIKHVEELKQDLVNNQLANERYEIIKEEKTNRSHTSQNESQMHSVFEMKEDESDIIKPYDQKETIDSRMESALDITNSREVVTTYKKTVDRSKIKLPSHKAKVDIKNLIKVMASK